MNVVHADLGLGLASGIPGSRRSPGMTGVVA
jgi:hypothetical protein